MTEIKKETLFPHRHQDSQEPLGERQNMLRAPSEELCCTAQIRVHPNLESALAESQARLRNLRSKLS